MPVPVGFDWKNVPLAAHPIDHNACQQRAVWPSTMGRSAACTKLGHSQDFQLNFRAALAPQ